MKRRSVLVVVTILALAITSYPARASATPSDTGTSGEARPVATEQNSPWTSGGVADGASEQAQAQQGTRNVPLMAVEPSRYKQEKAAADRGPAPGNPEAVALPQVQPAAPTMPTLFDGLDRPGAVNNGFVFNPPDTIVG